MGDRDSGNVNETLPDPWDPDEVTLDNSVLVTDEAHGRYEVGHVIGRGGQAVVYLAHDRHLGRTVAMKQPSMPNDADARASERTVKRFLAEARITAALEHPNIVPIHEIGRRPDGTVYSTQRLIDSDRFGGAPRNLGEEIADAEGLSERLALLPHVVDVCQATAYAHSRGVVHRDIKPENIVLGRFGETVLLDWGLARRVSDDVTVPIAIVGTPSYMSPEQATGDVPAIDERSDVWSLGAILYEVLTGRPPVVGDTLAEVLAKTRQGRIPAVRDLEPRVPGELAAIAERALALDPDDRYQNANDLAADIIAFSTGGRVSVYAYSALELARLFVSRHKLAAGIAASALLLLLIAGALVWRNYLLAEEYLGDARTNLAQAFVQRAREAEQRYQWDRAAAYYAAARVQDDRADARWGTRLAWQRSDIQAHRLHGHSRSVRAVAFSPDGRLLATAGADRTVRVWDVSTHRTLHELTGHTGEVQDLAFIQSGERIATVSGDGTLRMFDTRTGRPIETFLNHEHSLNSIDERADGTLAIAAEDGVTLLVHPGERASPEQIADPVGRALYDAAFSPNGEKIATASWDGKVRVHDIRTGAVIRTLDDARDAILDLAFSPSGDRLAAASRDNSVRIYRTANGRLEHVLEGHTQKVFAVAFSTDGKLLATGSTDRTVRLWHVATGQPLIDDSYGHEDDVRAVAFSPDGRLLAWAGSSTVWVRQLPTTAAHPRSGQRISDLVVSRDGRFVAHSFERKILVRRTEDLSVHFEYELQTEPRSLALSPDGGVLATNCRQGVCLIDTSDGRLLHHLPVTATTESLAFSPDGALLAFGDHSSGVFTIDVRTGNRRSSFVAHSNAVFAIAFSPDGRRLATGSYDRTARVWDVATGTPQTLLRGHEHGVRDIAFGPDGDVVATASWDETIRLWDLTGTCLHVLEGHGDHVWSVGFDPSGEHLASVSRDGTLRIWNVQDGEPLATMIASEPAVYGVAFANDGDRLLYAGHAVHELDLRPLGDPSTDLEQILRETSLRLDGVELHRVR